MSEEAVILGWWKRALSDRTAGHARGLVARLSRATFAEALTERAVHDLYGALVTDAGDDERRKRALPDGTRLGRLACLLAEVREHSEESLPKRLGGKDPILSNIRFQKILRADDDELHDQLRRAIRMAKNECNVSLLGRHLLHWGDSVKMRWCFDYYGEQAPNPAEAEA